MSHLEQLTQTDQQALKREDICALVKKKKNANFTINSHLSSCLVPIKRLVVSLQQEMHNPIKSYSVTEFASIIGKIKCFINKSFILEITNMTHFTLLMSKIRVKERKNH